MAVRSKGRKGEGGVVKEYFVPYDIAHYIALTPKFRRLSCSCFFLRNSNFPLS